MMPACMYCGVVGHERLMCPERVQDEVYLLSAKAKRRPMRLDAQGFAPPTGHQTTPGRITFEIRT